MDMESRIIELVKDACGEDGIEVTRETALVGVQRVLKSRDLVEICLSLEDLAEEIGFDFDWTSHAAMSQSRSIFRTVGSLVEHFESQR